MAHKHLKYVKRSYGYDILMSNKPFKQIPVQTPQATHYARMWWLNGKFNGIADWITVTDPTALKLIKAQPHLKNAILEIELHNGSN